MIMFEMLSHWNSPSQVLIQRYYRCYKLSTQGSCGISAVQPISFYPHEEYWPQFPAATPKLSQHVLEPHKFWSRRRWLVVNSVAFYAQLFECRGMYVQKMLDLVGRYSYFTAIKGFDSFEWQTPN